MNLLEILKKPFLKQDTIKDLEQTTMVEPENVTQDLDDSTDLALVLRSIKNDGSVVEKQLSYEDTIEQYNRIANSPEGNEAINEIINEMYNSTSGESIRIDLSEIEIGESVKKKITEAHEKILNLLKFNTQGRNHIFNWYKDGIFTVECIYDENNTKAGIKQLSILKPHNLKKIVQNKNGKKTVQYSFINNNITYMTYSNNKLIYDKEQLVTVTSGLVDSHGRNIGFLHPAIKSYNQMTMIEDILVVYRISRGTEKRIFKVNVGKLPRNKAMSYMQELMSRFKSKKVYNSNDGSVNNDSHLISLSEDIWLPTKESTKDIDIDTLSGGMNLGELDDLNYFRNKFYKSLAVPSNRFGKDQTDLMVSATEITRDEARFMNRIFSLRSKFNELFLELLKRQLISTNTLSEKEFNQIKGNIQYIYPDQTSFNEQRRLQTFKDKVDILQDVDDYVGKYFSKKFVFEDIFKMTEEEYTEMKEQIETEKKNGEYEEAQY